jgi:O-antigen ligase
MKTPISTYAEVREPLAPFASAAMQFAFLGLVLFTVVYFGRPEDWIHGTAVLPSAKATGLFAVLGVLVAVAFGRRPSDIASSSVIAILLLLQLSFTVFFSSWKTNSLDIVFNSFLKIVLIAGAMVLSIDRLQRLKAILTAHAVCLAAHAFVGLSRYSGGRLGGPVKGPFSNPNDLALILVVTIPFCLLLLQESRRLLIKLGWLTVTIILLLAIALTYSRGGFLSLFAVTLTCVYIHAPTWKAHPWIVLVILVMLIGLFSYRPTAYVQRLLTILTPSQDLTGSSQEREGLIRRSVEITLDNPLVGVGPGNFRNFTPAWRETHNTYMQFAAEAGIPALILFVVLLIHAFRNVSPRRFAEMVDRRLPRYAAAVRTSLIGYVVGAAFLSTAYEVFPYLLVSYSIIIARISRGSSPPLGEPQIRRELAARVVLEASLLSRISHGTGAFRAGS